VSEPVLILMGSKSDWDVLRETGAELDRFEIGWRAHGERSGVRVFICGAGMAAHLAGVVAAATTRPVIGVPLAGGVGDGLDALLSTVQMPGGVPVATVAVGKAGARNAAVLAAEILALSDPRLEERLRAVRTAQADAVAEADATLDRGRMRS